MSERSERIEGHAGELALAALAGFGVDTMFTLNGGHVWPLYDAAVKRGVRVVDTRHEQTAAWAAEGWAKLRRQAGLAVLTAGPGVTNGVSAITSAHFNGSPLVVLAGRAPQGRWGSGSLQELDHVPIVASITKLAMTVTDPSDTAKAVGAAAAAALTPHRGPVFVDFPMDVMFGSGAAEITATATPGSDSGSGSVSGSRSPGFGPGPVSGPSGSVSRPGSGPGPVSGPRSGPRVGWRGPEPDPEEVSRAAALIAGAERPAIIAGSDVYWGGAWQALGRVVEELAVPCFANGMGRGCLSADHPLLFSRTRGLLKTDADVVVVIGTPLDFRLGYGRFGDAAVVHLVDSDEGRARHAIVAVSVAGDLEAILDAMSGWNGGRADHRPWIARLRDAEDAALAAEGPLLTAAADPIKPMRVMGELKRRLERDAVVICDGGDFASYAGKYIDVYRPGCWLDTGPYGCLGNGLGYAVAARLARPDSQVVAVLGDGAAGFALMDIDTLVRHGLPAVLIVGNNGIWGLEKHPMRALYGWDIACDLQPGCRYDLVAQALGGGGELVTDPDQIGPALDRALASGVPYLVNVVTDPADEYPRSSNLG